LAQDFPAMPRVPQKVVELHLCREPQFPVPKDVGIDKYKHDVRDWRSVTPSKWLEELATAREADNHAYLAKLCAAVAVSTLQGCLHGFVASAVSDFRAGVAEAQAVRHDCFHISDPISVGFTSPPDPVPRALPSGGRRAAQLRCFDGVHPVDVLLQLEDRTAGSSMAMLHFVPEGEPLGLLPNLAAGPEVESLTLRTNFFQAIEGLDRHLHCQATHLLDHNGGVICSSNVAILRGDASTGFRWLDHITRFDVYTISLPRHPGVDKWGRYSTADARELVRQRVELAFAAAAARGVEVLVSSPLGLSRNCKHPPLEIADILHKAACNHMLIFDVIAVASASPSHGGQWWTEFANSFRFGRPPIDFGDPVYDVHAYANVLPFVKFQKSKPSVVPAPRELRRTFL